MKQVERKLKVNNPTAAHIAAMKDVKGFLVKSEPFKYSWEQFEIDKKTFWDGVRNYAARNFLIEMSKGDEVLFYHSNVGLEIVGVAEVVKESYQDPTTDDSAWVVVDLKPKYKLKKPIGLATLKADILLQDMVFIKIGRLSVSPVTHKQWAVIMELAQ